MDRAIHDFDVVAEGSAGESSEADTVETDTFGDSSQLSTGTTETPDPGVECTIPEDCGTGQTCYEGVCVGTGNVRVSLAWNVVTDLDLHVGAPNGEWISYQNAITTYGQLDVDDCVSGTCLDQNGTHVENVFLNENAPRGRYSIMIINFDGREAADYTIEVAGEVGFTFSGSLPATMFVEGPVHEFDW